MQSPVTRRYARALYDVSIRRGILSKVADDVELIGEVFQQNPRLGSLLENPQVPPDRKKALLGDVFGPRVQPLTLQFCQLLVDKGRADILQYLNTEFQRLSDAAAGIVRARVQTAVPLSETQEARMVQQLSAITGKTVILSTEVEPSIRGGAVVWIGDRVIDGSVAGNLASLESRLAP